LNIDRNVRKAKHRATQMNTDYKRINDFLKEHRGFDFSGYCTPIVEERISQRITTTECCNYSSYFRFLQNNPDELDLLIGVLTINVSQFFRDTLTFDYIFHQILPALLFHKKNAHKNLSLRVWSSGCSMGEEPFSIAIMINELLEKEASKYDVRIFATDIDRHILKKAKKAVYSYESIEDIKYKLIEKYFTRNGKLFHLQKKIKEMVSFSVYDILSKNSFAPPESIFGAFDMVFCRNLLIYFNKEFQEMIFEKLYRSLAWNGYLILGQAEVPLAKYLHTLKKVSDCCYIYQKF